MKLEEQDIKYVYTAGNQIEIWILSLCEELKGKV